MNTTSMTEGCVSAEIDSDSNSDWMSGDCFEKKPAVCSLISGKYLGSPDQVFVLVVKGTCCLGSGKLVYKCLKSFAMKCI